MTPIVLAVISVIIGIFPLLVAGVALIVAAACGCELSEAGPQPCLFLGKDIGDILADMFVFAWMTLLTGGVGVAGVIGSVVWALQR